MGFWALACPWVLFMLFPSADCGVPNHGQIVERFEPLEQHIGLKRGILWLLFSLVFLWLCLLGRRSFSLNKAAGYLLIVVYCAYLVLTICDSFIRPTHMTL